MIYNYQTTFTYVALKKPINLRCVPCDTRATVALRGQR